MCNVLHNPARAVKCAGLHLSNAIVGTTNSMLWQSINLPWVQVCKQECQQKRFATQQVKEREQEPCAQRLDGVINKLMDWVVECCAGLGAFLRSAAQFYPVVDVWCYLVVCSVHLASMAAALYITAIPAAALCDAHFT